MCFFQTFVIKVPDDGSAELKDVAPISVVFGCILHLYFSIVQHNGMN